MEVVEKGNMKSILDLEQKRTHHSIPSSQHRGWHIAETKQRFLNKWMNEYNIKTMHGLRTRELASNPGSIVL